MRADRTSSVKARGRSRGCLWVQRSWIWNDPHVEFLGDPWPQITGALRKAKKRIAVTPYLNGDAYAMLPLRRSKDLLVVDACERNVKSGVTNPHEIERFLRSGVRCFTVDDLHAKAYLADNNLFVGSANGSTNSRNTLIEACLQVNNAAAAEQFEAWLGGLALVPLTKERISELKAIYKPPRWPKNGGSGRRRASAWIVWVKGADETDETQQFLEHVSSKYDLKPDDIYSVTVARNNKVARIAKAGDDFFVLDHDDRRIEAMPPMRLIERSKLIGTQYRLALEWPDYETVTFSVFLKAIRKVYPGFSSSGKSQRAISAKAAAELRKVWR